MTEKQEYDVIIVGAGAAGLTAAIYTTRRALATLIISEDVGGQAAMTNDIENYPGFELIPGPELMGKFLAQAQKFGAELVSAQVAGVAKNADGNFSVKTATGTLIAKAIILCFGLSHRHLGVPGESELTGKGVSFCATCDAPLYKNRRVAVVGGGMSALDAALLLAHYGNDVTLINRSAEFTGEKVLLDRAKAEPKITSLVNSAVTKVNGTDRVASITVGPTTGPGAEQELPVDGVFISIGYMVKPDIIKGLVELDARNQIVISKDNETSMPGVFAAGDVTTIAYKQIVISAGEGAKAALSAYKFLVTKRGVHAADTDWGAVKKQ